MNNNKKVKDTQNEEINNVGSFYPIMPIDGQDEQKAFLNKNLDRI